MTGRISIEKSFQWAQRFVAREWRLALPVVLAFLLLPPLAMDFFLPPGIARMLATPQTQSIPAVRAAVVWLLPLILVILLFAGAGTLALFALALRPRVSVGEAIALAVRRLPVLAGSVALLMLGLLVATTLVSLLLQSAGLGMVQAQGIILLLLMITMAVMVVRLALLGPIVIERRVGPIEAIAASWRLGRGSFWRMLGALAIFMVGSFVVLLALNTAVAATVLIVARAMGTPDVGAALINLFTRLGAAVVNAGATVLVAGFYRQLVEPSRGI